MKRVLANIHTDALQHNLARIKTLMPGKRILAMIKANGYGHGLLTAAEAFHAADALGVAAIEEAITLRQAGIEQPIVLMPGFTNREELRDIFHWKLDIVVHHVDQVAELHRIKESDFTDPIRVWLKMETGMHRLGLMPADFLTAYQQLHASPVISDIIATMHFAQTESEGAALSDQQLACFESTIKGLDVQTSVANSMAIISTLFPEHALLSKKSIQFVQTTDWIRPGMMLYGVSPVANAIGADFGLQPALELESRLISIKALNPGDAVGYGSTWVCTENTHIGIVSVGYGDGYPRSAASGTPTLVGHAICPIIGRVSMDMLAVDLRAAPNAHIGERVILWGKELPVETVASGLQLSPYELLTHLNQRVFRGNRQS